ncbi:MAG: hypothetical protein NDJ90_03955, partial [Oligoflexia bacterium]|nr:hypothetical protein [Oligoflexia bacterium]
MRALPFALVVVCALAFGVFGGLGRLGGLASWNLPPPVIGLHGPLMVLGFLGTVISLERAKALGRTWGYLAPALTAVGVVLLLAGNALAAPLVLVGQALLVVILAIFFARDRALYSAILLGAAVSLLAGSAFYLSGQPVSRAVFWWMSFLTLTIAGERLELGRLIRIGPVSRVIFLTLACLLPLGAVCASLVPPDAMGKMRGAYPFGAGLLGLSLWLSLKDVARRTIRFGGLPRFIATCLLSGNAWLGISGGLLLAYGGLGG